MPELINDLIVLVIGAAVGAAAATLIAWGIVRVSKTDMERMRGQLATMHQNYDLTWAELLQTQAELDQLRTELDQQGRPLNQTQKRILRQITHDIDVLMFKALEDDTLPRIEPIPESL